MSETKFTPGPWTLDIGYTRAYLDAPSWNRTLAEIFIDGCYQGRRNAHLIAAAPDLYEALEGLMESWELGEELGGLAYVAAEAALAKARGEKDD